MRSLILAFLAFSPLRAMAGDMNQSGIDGSVISPSSVVIANITSGSVVYSTAPNGSNPGTLTGTPSYLFINGNNGNVGIGTTSPAFLLEVNKAGVAALAGFQSDSTDSSNIRLINTSAGGKNWAVGSEGSGASLTGVGNLFFYDVSDASLPLVLTTGGNVGIGTSAPAQKLDVTAGVVRASTSTTSGTSICLAGAFQTLPTSGYSKGCLALQLSDNAVYVATNTVTESGSWQKVGSQ